MCWTPLFTLYISMNVLFVNYGPNAQLLYSGLTSAASVQVVLGVLIWRVYHEEQEDQLGSEATYSESESPDRKKRKKKKKKKKKK